MTGKQRDDGGPAWTLEQAACIELLAEFALGKHHLPVVREWGDGVCVNWHGNLATTDFDGLTRLVLLAHKYAVRIEIGWSGPGMVRIIAHKRMHGERKTLGFSRWHPDLDYLRTSITMLEARRK